MKENNLYNVRFFSNYQYHEYMYVVIIFLLYLPSWICSEYFSSVFTNLLHRKTSLCALIIIHVHVCLIYNLSLNKSDLQIVQVIRNWNYDTTIV